MNFGTNQATKSNLQAKYNKKNKPKQKQLIYDVMHGRWFLSACMFKSARVAIRFSLSRFLKGLLSGMTSERRALLRSAEGDADGGSLFVSLSGFLYHLNCRKLLNWTVARIPSKITLQPAKSVLIRLIISPPPPFFFHVMQEIWILSWLHLIAFPLKGKWKEGE